MLFIQQEWIVDSYAVGVDKIFYAEIYKDSRSLVATLKFGDRKLK